jgi:Fic family protein
MRKYIHELARWPEFQWDYGRLALPLAEVRHSQGRLLGHMEALGFELRQEAALAAVTQEVVKSSEIEGERLDLRQVRSSVARRLGIDIGALAPADRHVDGVVEMILDATGNYREPLTRERLFGWQAALFPTGYSGLLRIRTGGWREDKTGPMQVVSGRPGRERVHFEAPAAKRVNGEMRKFLAWFRRRDAGTDPVLEAALAHFWFVTIHPFEDGNGRIARAIADMALARAEGSGHRFYSMSAQIRQERSDYYRILERSQSGTLDITPWMEWFVGCLGRAIEGSRETLGAVIEKARFWDVHRETPMNPRQRGMVNRLLDGLEGKLTSSKWAALAKCSPDTALRDLGELVDNGVLARGPAGGRSTSYELVRAAAARVA